MRWPPTDRQWPDFKRFVQILVTLYYRLPKANPEQGQAGGRVEVHQLEDIDSALNEKDIYGKISCS